MNMIKLGKILKPFGVHGELKIYSYTDFPEERFAVGKTLILENGGRERFLLKVSGLRALQEPCWALRFETVNGMNEAERLRDYCLYLEEKDIPPLKEGEYYFRDLINCEVYQSGCKAGVVTEVNEGIASNYLRVLTVEGKEKLVPFLPKFIVSVDKKSKKIEVIAMEGLL